MADTLELPMPVKLDWAMVSTGVPAAEVPLYRAPEAEVMTVSAVPPLVPPVIEYETEAVVWPYGIVIELGIEAIPMLGVADWMTVKVTGVADAVAEPFESEAPMV